MIHTAPRPQHLTRHQRLQLVPVPEAQLILDQVGRIRKTGEEGAGGAFYCPQPPPGLFGNVVATRIEKVNVLKLLHESADVAPLVWLEITTEWIWD
jgi:hypothetical protein